MTERILFSIHPRYLITRIAENSSILNDIQDQGGDGFNISEGYPAAYAKPFEKGGKPLNRAELNNIFNLLSQLHFYWQMGGAPLWDRRIAEGEGMYAPLSGYPRNARVHKMIESNLVEFISQVDNNTVEPVSGDTEFWKQVTLGSDVVSKKLLYELSGNAKTADESLERKIIEISSRSNEGKVLNVVSDKTSVIEILEETGHASDVFHSGDVLIVTNTISSCQFKSSYAYDGTDWCACNGYYDAAKILIDTPLDLAGNYKSIGNLDKGSIGAVVKDKFPKGTSIQDIISQMIDQVVEPSIKSLPTVSIELRNGGPNGELAGEVEAGSMFTPYYSATYNDGEFTCAGVVTDAGCQKKGSYYVIDTRGIAGPGLQSSYIYPEFMVGDQPGSTDTISSYCASCYIHYGESNKAKNNKGVETELIIPSGQTIATSSTTVSGIRYMFWGMSPTSKEEGIYSEAIRSLKHCGKPKSGTLPRLKSSEWSGAKCCIIAIPNTSTLKPTSVILPNSMKAEIVDLFKLNDSTRPVRGKNNYFAVPYRVWVYQPASIGSDEEYDITIG